MFLISPFFKISIFNFLNEKLLNRRLLNENYVHTHYIEFRIDFAFFVVPVMPFLPAG
tara:strand:+ start:536 stop:706 length:171 start_codon:yes stop_codon:yes gene_type:complete